MNAPVWLGYILAGLMLTVSGYCAARLLTALRLGKTTELDTDVMHVVMGVAMAGMLVAQLRTLPVAAWEVTFGFATAWFAWRLLSSRLSPGRLSRGRGRGAGTPWRCRPTAHLVECAAMLYMFLVLPAVGPPAKVTASGMPTMTAAQARFSLLALAMIVYLVGFAARETDRLPALAPARLSAAVPPPSAVPPPAVPAFLAPRCAVLCKIAMAVTMSYALVLML